MVRVEKRTERARCCDARPRGLVTENTESRRHNRQQRHGRQPSASSPGMFIGKHMNRFAQVNPREGNMLFVDSRHIVKRPAA